MSGAIKAVSEQLNTMGAVLHKKGAGQSPKVSHSGAKRAVSEPLCTMGASQHKGRVRGSLQRVCAGGVTGEECAGFEPRVLPSHQAKSPLRVAPYNSFEHGEWRTPEG